MSRYPSLLGCRIEVTYRASDIVIPATGILAADSGKSIFIEESYRQKNQDALKTFRWEIPYACIVELRVCPEIPPPSASVINPREPASEPSLGPADLQFNKRPA